MTEHTGGEVVRTFYRVVWDAEIPSLESAVIEKRNGSWLVWRLSSGSTEKTNGIRGFFDTPKKAIFTEIFYSKIWKDLELGSISSRSRKGRSHCFAVFESLQADIAALMDLYRGLNTT